MACMDMANSLTYGSPLDEKTMNKALLVGKRNEESENCLSLEYREAEFRAIDYLYEDSTQKLSIEPHSFSSVLSHTVSWPLPIGWFSDRDKKNNEYFYKDDGTIEWTPPVSPVNPMLKDLEWLKLKDEEGNFYFYNKLTEEVIYDNPVIGVELTTALGSVGLLQMERAFTESGHFALIISNWPYPEGYGEPAREKPKEGYRTLLWYFRLRGEAIETYIFDPSPFAMRWDHKGVVSRPSLCTFKDRRDSENYIHDVFLQDRHQQQTKTCKGYWKVWTLKAFPDSLKSGRKMIITQSYSELSRDWIEQKQDGYPCWRNIYTKEIVWEKPSFSRIDLVTQSWEEVKHSGKRKWVNQITGAVSWLEPNGPDPNTNMWLYRPGPNDWFNPITKRIQKEDPLANPEDTKTNARAFDIVDEDQHT